MNAPGTSPAPGFRRLCRVLRNQDGTAVVELALLLPLFIITYITVLYFADLIIAQSRVANAADAVAKTASSVNMCLKDAPDQRIAIFNAAKALIPERDTLTGMVLTSLVPEKDADGDKTGAWQVEWSFADPGASETGYSFDTEQEAAFGDARVWDKPLMFARVSVNHTPSIVILDGMISRDIQRVSIVPAFSATATCP